MEAWLDQVLTSQAGVIHTLIIYAANGGYGGGRSLYVANGAWVQANVAVSNADAIMAIINNTPEGTKLNVGESSCIYISLDDEYEINGTVCTKLQYKGKADNAHPENVAGCGVVVTPNKNVVILGYGPEYAQKVPHIAIDSIAKYLMDNGY